MGKWKHGTVSEVYNQKPHLSESIIMIYKQEKTCNYLFPIQILYINITTYARSHPHPTGMTKNYHHKMNLTQ